MGMVREMERLCMCIWDGGSFLGTDHYTNYTINKIDFAF